MANNEEFKKFVDSLENSEKEATFGQVAPAKEIKEEVEETEPRTNRRERRLEQKLQAEREAGIAMAERIKVLSELAGQREKTSGQEEIDPRLSKIFGDYEKGKEISQEFSSLLKDYSVKAREEAVKEFEERQNQSVEQAKQEEGKYVDFLKSEFDKIEDNYGVDLEGDSETRGKFVDFIAKLSPKDEDGNIKGYPDIEQAWETFQSTKKVPDNTRRDEVASRSMVKSGNVIAQGKKITPGFYGWRQDLNL